MNITEHDRKRQRSCNFCDRGILNEYGTGLDYPYDKVFLLEGRTMSVTICEDCLNKIKNFTPSKK